MKNQTAGDVLRSLRLERKWGRQKLADMSGCHLQTVLRLERGQMKMTEEWISRMAAALDVSPSLFLPTSSDITEAVALPVMSWDSVGLDRDAAPDAQVDVVMLPKSDEGRDLAAYRYEGEEMLPLLLPGDIVMIDRRRQEFEDGGYYVLHRDSSRAADLCIFLADPDRLIHENRPHELLRPIARCVHGRVVRVIRYL